mmetsp:Transcript_11902/g.32882  ORF Transcript_11902/g.32882 Transcript_11902/m.32882 type:complete len:319 (-) Transcript_11902:710-1666(-)
MAQRANRGRATGTARREDSKEAKGKGPVGGFWTEERGRKLRSVVHRLATARLGGAKREPDVYVTSTLPVQGQTVAVFVSLAKPRTPFGWVQRSLCTFAHDSLVCVTFDGKPVPSYPVKRSKTKRNYPIYRALIPTTPADPPGERVLEVRVLDGCFRPMKIPCTIQKQAFGTQHIWLGKDKSGLLADRRRKWKKEDSMVSQRLSIHPSVCTPPPVAGSRLIPRVTSCHRREFAGQSLAAPGDEGADVGWALHRPERWRHHHSVRAAKVLQRQVRGKLFPQGLGLWRGQGGCGELACRREGCAGRKGGQRFQTARKLHRS